MKRNTLNLLIILVLALALLPVSYIARADAYTVDTVADENDGSCGDGDCSLRDAIILANNSTGPDTISFAISGSGVHTITLGSFLPTLTGGGITIDGYSQTGALEATGATPAVLKIVIDGSGTFGYGLAIASASNVIEGLTINNCTQEGIAIAGSGATGNVVSGNHIGTDAGGTIPLGNQYGVAIYDGAQNNTVGGDEAGERNIISGNAYHGVLMYGSGTTGNVVSGNYIGTDASGAADLGNALHGVSIGVDAQNNTVGGDTAGKRNVISGNNSAGVSISGSGATGSIVSGNIIGLDADGAADLGNTLDGVSISGGAQNNTIGGATADEGNVISGNYGMGVNVEGSGTTGNVISGNTIGLSADGAVKRGNSLGGVSISGGAQNNTVGGDTAGERNVISGNLSTGVSIFGSGATSNTVSGNYIGVDASGAAALDNTDGVAIYGGAQNNTVGGGQVGERNVISGNSNHGVAIYGSGTTGNVVSGNYIGPNAGGTAALYNVASGVSIENGAQNNTVGGDEAGERNVISGNSGAGVSISGSGSTGNLVSGNYIGPAANGAADLGNISDGVHIQNGAHNNTIGGDTANERNVISGNGRHGVLIEGSGTTNNTVSGNYVGPDASGAANLGNSQYGVYIKDGAQNNVIGGNAPGKGNVISGSYYDGVLVYGSGATGNTIAANSIHDNGGAGINLYDGGNTELAAPTITSASKTGASGAGCAWCTIHIYSDDSDEGETWHAPLVNTDDSGNWSYSGAISGPYVTATNTDSSGNTSEFSTPKLVGFAVYLPLVLNSVDGLVAHN